MYVGNVLVHHALATLLNSCYPDHAHELKGNDTINVLNPYGTHFILHFSQCTWYLNHNKFRKKILNKNLTITFNLWLLAGNSTWQQLVFVIVRVNWDIECLLPFLPNTRDNFIESNFVYQEVPLLYYNSFSKNHYSLTHHCTWTILMSYGKLLKVRA